MTPKMHYKTVGRNRFSPDPKDGTAIDIGGGASLWVGTFTSVRLGWKPMLNVDLAIGVGIDEGSVIEFIEKALKSCSGYHQSHISLNDKKNFDNVSEKVKYLKISYNVPGGYKRNYRVIKMVPAANKLKVKLDSGEECTIEKYFKDKYEYQLKFPNYPCVHVGKPEKTIYLPIELCMLKKQVLPPFKHISNNQRQEIMKAAAKWAPTKRRLITEKNLRNLSNHYDQDPYANAFGIKVKGEMMQVNGRVLDSPALKYNNGESKVIEFNKVHGGKWSPGKIGNKNTFKFFKPRHLKSWGILDLANVPDNVKKQFVDRLFREGNHRGVIVDYRTYDNANTENLSQAKEAFRKLHDFIKMKNESIQLIMIITAKKGPLRAELKYLS